MTLLVTKIQLYLFTPIRTSLTTFYRPSLRNIKMAESSNLQNPFKLPDTDAKGEFIRKDSVFRQFITKDGSSGYPSEPNRYHLYVSFGCPWANRTLIFLNLKGLKDVISVDIVDRISGGGWSFNDKTEGCTLDSIHNFQYLRQVYELSDPTYSGKHVVPTLFDKKSDKIVNNESSEIIRMFNTEFNQLAKYPERDFYPQSLREQIDQINEYVYSRINNGVYKCGFATTQSAYDENVESLFEALDKIEDILSKQRYLCGENLTEADVRLFVTLIRFDAVYVQHFKCNLKRIQDYPNLSGYLRELYQLPEFGSTIHIDRIKKIYFKGHKNLDPLGIIPKGPLLDFESPHCRDHLPGHPW